MSETCSVTTEFHIKLIYSCQKILQVTLLALTLDSWQYRITDLLMCLTLIYTKLVITEEENMHFNIELIK